MKTNAIQHLTNMVKSEFLENELQRFKEIIRNPNSRDGMEKLSQDEFELEIVISMIETMNENKIIS